MRRLPHAGAALYILYILSAPTLAHADAGELLVGAEAKGELTPAAGVDAVAQFGLNDLVSLRGWLGGRYGEASASSTRAALDVGVGVVCAWDVLSWVPELMLGGGVRSRAGGAAAETLATVALRRFFGPTWSLSIGGGGGWRFDGNAYGTAHIGLWRRLP